jgi:SAM-dependent methyltransferase
MAEPAIAEGDYAGWKGWREAAFGRCPRTQRDIFDAEWARLRLGRPAGRRVLELGFGHGAFAGWCRSTGAVWLGVEANPLLVEWAGRAGFDATTALPESGRYDVVCAFDVFEHVPGEELPGLMTRLRGLLSPGGIVLARFPNGDSPLGLPHQYGDWTHCTVIGEGRWRQLAHETGFDCTAWLSPALPLNWRRPMTLLRRLAVLTATTATALVVRGLFFGRSSWQATPNVVTHLRVRGD